MNTALIIGVIAILVLALPAVMWLTKLIRPPNPQSENIDRKLAETRKAVRHKIGRLPPI